MHQSIPAAPWCIRPHESSNSEESIIPWILVMPSTSSPRRFSLALGPRPQSQRKAPWGRGWIVMSCENREYMYILAPESWRKLFSWYLHLVLIFLKVLCISQSVNSSCAQPPPPRLLRGICPPCHSRGWGICKSCAARGPGICQPRGQPRAFDTHAVSYQNIHYTEDFTGKTNRLAHLSRMGKNWRGL